MFNEKDLGILCRWYVPDGKWDKQGRFYPAENELCECCEGIRSPSYKWPKSLWKHCQTKKHVKNITKKSNSLSIYAFKVQIVQYRIKALMPSTLTISYKQYTELTNYMVPLYDFKKGITDEFKKALELEFINHVI